MMFLHTLGQRISRDLGAMIAGRNLNTGDVVFHWDAAPGPTDRNVEASYSAASPQAETKQGLIHWVSVRSVAQGAFSEFQAGDAIVTFTADVVIAGKRGLYFTLPDGNDYVQANVGKKVIEFWDVYVGGEALSITLLLRRKG